MQKLVSEAPAERLGQVVSIVGRRCNFSEAPFTTLEAVKAVFHGIRLEDSREQEDEEEEKGSDTEELVFEFEELCTRPANTVS